MINIAICDDIAMQTEILASLIKKYPSDIQMEISSFFTGESLVEKAAKEGEKYDIIFMDVKLSEETTGIQIVKRIKVLMPYALIVYVSGYENYYIDLVETESFGFIKKPFTQEKVNKVLDDAFIHMKARHSQYCFSFKGVINIIDLYDISYIYSDYRRIYFHNYKTNKELYCYMKLDELVEELKNLCPLFVQVNKSYLVNIYKVTNVYRNSVYIGDYCISVTENYREASHKKIFEARNFYI